MACRKRPPSSSARICENAFERGDIAHVPGLLRPDLFAVLHARSALPRSCARRTAASPNSSTRFISHVLPKRVGALLNTRAGHFGGLLLLSNLAIGLLLASSTSSTAAPCLRSAKPSARRCGWCISRCWCSRGVIAWLIVLAHESRRAAEARIRAPDDHAHGRNRRTQAHRRGAAEGQGSRRERQCRQDPLHRRHQPRDPHAAQFDLRLCAVARARRRGSLRQRHPRDPSQRRTSGESHRRPARHLQDRKRHAAAESRQGAARRVSRPDRRHVPAAGRGQGHRVRLSAPAATCPPSCTPTRSACGRS